MADFVVTIKGDKEFREKLLAFVGQGLDLKKSMNETGDYLTRFWSGEVFVSRGGVINERWADLNPSYAAWKARMWPGRPPLVRTGLMQQGFRHKSTKLSTELWNEAEYFKYHQEGWGVPERVMMKVDDQRGARIAKYVIGDITDQMKARGLI